MKASREMDASVTEHVMGLIYFRLWRNSHGQPVPHITFRKHVKQNNQTASPLKHYSTSWVYAFEVRDKVKKMGPIKRRIFIQSLDQQMRLGNDLTCFYIPEEEWILYIQPVHICVAALKAAEK